MSRIRQDGHRVVRWILIARWTWISQLAYCHHIDFGTLDQSHFLLESLAQNVGM
jgi:hypothetical protein